MGFRKDFLWGAATAAYQIEGASGEDGKGKNVWDMCDEVVGKIAHNETGAEACDHYHRYAEDIARMKELGIKAYRFSISWSRILPEGTGRVNQAGIAFYSDLVDKLLEAGIEPLVTLFHWDYPFALNQKGAWLHPESSDWFEEYTKIVVEALSDRVTYWMTFNEPQICINLGYNKGIFAPFEKHPRKELAQMSHNLLLSHGKAVKAIRLSAVKKPVIGFAFTAPSVVPEVETAEGIEEARRKTFSINAYGEEDFLYSNTWWADPIFFGDYPEDAYELLGDDMPEIKKGDMEIISQPVDFFGGNIYQTLVPEVGPYSYAQNAYQGSPRTSTGWAITPEVLYWSPKFFTQRYQVPFMVTENGLAGNDFVSMDGKVHDPQRIDYMHRYLLNLRRAAEEGIEILGYNCWTLLDNFEWASGYDMRFGLIYVDYRTQKRTIKDSAYWYKEVMSSNGENL